MQKWYIALWYVLTPLFIFSSYLVAQAYRYCEYEDLKQNILGYIHAICMYMPHIATMEAIPSFDLHIQFSKINNMATVEKVCNAKKPAAILIELDSTPHLHTR